MSVAIGSTVAHFEILAKIGEGGMGEVYRARDTKLGREVAFKVLPEAVAADPERLTRFQREARTVAALNHPNIVTIHSVDEADGIHFLTMELVAGEALNELIPKNGFPLDRLFALAIPIADAVASAHSSGIVHRDLKPENVMLDDQGRVKVLDFGLAKVAEAPPRADGATETAPLTEDGRVMGTVPYMSPEQVRGRVVDARSDIFSLGVMLYEMAAGRRPFAGDSSAEVMAAIQRDTAETLSTVRGDLPRHLGRIIQHCLEKDPDRRYQSAVDVRNELEHLQREVGSDAPSIGAASTGGPPGARPHVESGLAVKTLLVTDLVASTKLVEALGDERAAEVMASHDRMVRDLAASCGGREIDKTDGFLLLFDRPLDAVRCAVLYHRRLAGLGSEQGLELRARAGIHVGEVVLRANPPEDVARGAKPLEVEGLAKPTAARLMSLARGGQTLLTRGAFDLARRSAVGSVEKLGELRWQSHGAYRMKGVEEPIRVFEVAEEALAPLGPPPSSDKVTRLASGELSAATATTAPRPGDSRKWWLAAAAAALLALALGFGYRSIRPEPEAPAAPSLVANRVVVAEFENRTGDPSLDHFGRTIAETLTQGLSEISEIDLLPARPLAPAFEQDRADAVRHLAEETGASLIVTGDFSPAEGGQRLQAAVTAAETMRPLYGIDEISASRVLPEEIVEDFRQRVMALAAILNQPEEPPRSRTAALSVETWPLYFSKPPRHDALLEYRAGWGQFGRDYPRAFRHFERAVDLDPGFVTADLTLAVAYMNSGQNAKAEAILAKWESTPHTLPFTGRKWLAYFRASLEGRRAEALQRIEELYRRTSDPEAGYLLGYGAVQANRPELAIETFASYLDDKEESLPSHSGDSARPHWGWSFWPVAYHLAGDYEEELSLARRMSERYPQSLNIRLGEVRALIALGEAVELDRVLEEVLATPSSDLTHGGLLRVAAEELSAHGRPEDSLRLANLAVDWYHEQAAGDAAATRGSWGLGDALYLAGRWREARSVFASIAEDNPESVHVLGYLGVLSARLGEHDEARRISERLAAWADPFARGSDTYWRASIAAALGERDEAVRNLRAAFAEGLSFWSNMTSNCHADTNLEPLRRYPPFDRLMAPKVRTTR